MARTRALDYEDRKKDILRAAAVLFAQQGYSETLLEDIAAQCGVKKSSLYHYHSSKHAILYSLITWKIEDLAWKIDAAIEAASAPKEKFQAFTTTLVNEYIRVPEEMTVLLTQMRYLNKPAMKSVIQIQDRIINRAVLLIQSLRPDIEISRKNVTAMAMLYFGMTNWIPVWYKPSGSIKPADLSTMISELFLNGISAPDFPIIGHRIS
ncbi:TetR/AcrR family transcriptional regulator [Neopusillimonas aromaticivorans]|uniref:TetR/AcrR family transcriptional regulator n=1 Tax=Neopusillimonas aromaticivorans TaxID=2979868 RepID=UPI002591C672|nr:TetR/AcrR family transcriptional regulator [Neopusillimonas aromaticivorans]WJJ92637.1 TetR/AcrR family transcriptional regulator [Neopusillimonas aromaticivorans]